MPRILCRPPWAGRLLGAFVGNGLYDDIAPVTNGQAIVDRITNATLHVYEGGHLFLLQDPAAWSAIVAFLGA
jgi:3-oxoadipate enol-lactonase